MSNIVPLPARLEPKSIKRALMSSVRGYFYPLYNSNNPKFRSMLTSIDNKTAITGNRFFDRKEAVDMIVEAAEHAKDTVTAEAKAGDLYHCLVRVMNEHEELRLKLRRMEYERIQHQQAAE